MIGRQTDDGDEILQCQERTEWKEPRKYKLLMPVKEESVSSNMHPEQKVQGISVLWYNLLETLHT
jgi:hypothetical protein